MASPGTSAAGSLWNKSSWHWEEKNYGKWAVERLQIVIGGIGSVEYPGIPGSFYRFTNVIAKGYASVSVRKGKRIVTYEYEIAFDWDLVGCAGVGGKVVIPEYSSEEDKPEFKVSVLDRDVEIVKAVQELEEKRGIQAEAVVSDTTYKCKEHLRKFGSKAVFVVLEDEFVKVMSELEGDASKLAADKQRREQELTTANQAREEKGDEKSQIAVQQKVLEQTRKDNMAERVGAPESSQPKGEGSVWNTNSYHWETKNLVSWAHEYLGKALNSLVLSPEISGKDVALRNVSVSGDAEVSIRKGKKLMVYDLQINGDFSADGVNCGSFSISQFSSEDDVQADLRIKWSCGDVELLGRLKDQGKAVLVKEVLLPFLEEFKKQG